MLEAYKLIEELLRRGVSDKDASKVVGGNLLRVWKKVDEVALHKLWDSGSISLNKLNTAKSLKD
jgi:hypothetical protein